MSWRIPTEARVETVRNFSFDVLMDTWRIEVRPRSAFESHLMPERLRSVFGGPWHSRSRSSWEREPMGSDGHFLWHSSRTPIVNRTLNRPALVWLEEMQQAKYNDYTVDTQCSLKLLHNVFCLLNATQMLTFQGGIIISSQQSMLRLTGRWHYPRIWIEFCSEKSEQTKPRGCHQLGNSHPSDGWVILKSLHNGTHQRHTLVFFFVGPLGVGPFLSITSQKQKGSEGTQYQQNKKNESALWQDSMDPLRRIKAHSSPDPAIIRQRLL